MKGPRTGVLDCVLDGAGLHLPYLGADRVCSGCRMQIIINRCFKAISLCGEEGWGRELTLELTDDAFAV